MYGRCVALLVVMAFAVTAHAEDVTPNQMARTVDDLDAVEFIQEGDEMEADPKADPSKGPYAEAIAKGVKQVVEAQATAAKKNVELSEKNEQVKAATSEKLQKEKDKLAASESATKTKAAEGAAKSEAMSAEADSKMTAKVEEAKEAGRKESAKEAVQEREKSRAAESSEKQASAEEMKKQKMIDAKRAEETHRMNLAQESAQKTEKADLLADKARLQAKVKELTIQVSDAVRKGQAQTVRNFPAKYKDLQLAHSQLFDKYTTLNEKYKTCGSTETAFQKCKKELADVPKIKAKMVSKLVTKLKEARALILRAKESVVKAKTSAPNSEIQDVKAQDARLIQAAKEGEARAQREASREEMKARDAEAAVGPQAKEIAAKDEKGMQIKLGTMRSEEDRIIGKDHELREKNAQDETKIQNLEAKSNMGGRQGVSTNKFNAMQEGLQHKLRVEEREMSREEENAEAEVNKAKNEAAIAQEALKQKAQGVEPEDYAKALAEAKAEKQKLMAMQAEFKDKLENQRKEDAEKLEEAEEAAKSKEEKMEADASEKVIEATGLRAAKDAAALARRRSSDSKMQKLLNQIQRPDPVPGSGDDVIPDNMETALANANPVADISELKEKLAEKLKQEDIENVEKAREASSDEEIQKIKSKLAFKKAAYAAIAAGKAKSEERDGKSYLRKLTAKQTLDKVKEGALMNALASLKQKLAVTDNTEEARTLKKSIAVAAQRVETAKADYAKSAAKTDTALDAARTAAEKQVSTAKEAANMKVKMANTVANARRAKILIAKVDLLKAEEVVKNAREGRNMVYKALETALQKHTPEGQAKADRLKAVLNNMESVIDTARTSVEEARKSVMQDEAESIRADANEKLAHAEASTSTTNSKNALKAKMTALIEQTKNELNVPDTDQVTAAQTVQVVHKGNAETTKVVHSEGGFENISDLKRQLKSSLKSEIGNVMANNQGKSPSEIKAILKRKLKAMLARKIANSHSSDPAVAHLEELARQDQAQVGSLRHSASGLEAQVADLKRQLAAEHAKVTASSAAAKADVMAHSKAMVAERLDPSSSTRQMAADSAAAASSAVSEARAASGAAAADKRRIAALERRLARTQSQLSRAEDGAHSAETAASNRQVRDASFQDKRDAKALAVAKHAKDEADASLKQATDALNSAKATGNMRAINAARNMRDAAVEAQQTADSEYQSVLDKKQGADRKLGRATDGASELARAQRNEEASGVDDFDVTTVDTSAAVAAVQQAKSNTISTKSALQSAEIQNKNAQDALASAQASGNADMVASAEKASSVARANLQKALAADNMATTKHDAAARALSRAKATQRQAIEEHKNAQIAATSRKVAMSEAKVNDLKLQASQEAASIKKGEAALVEANSAADKAKHALAVAQQANLISAANAAQTMMATTNQVVSAATSKLASQKNKLRVLNDDIAREEASASAAASHIDTLKGVSTGSSGATNPEAGAGADKAGARVAEAELLRRESEAQKAQENVAAVTKKVHAANIKADAIMAQEIAQADATKAKQQEDARAKKETKDAAAEKLQNAADRNAASKAAAVDAQTSPEAAKVAATEAEDAQRNANAEEVKRKEANEADKVADQTEENAAEDEARTAIRNAKQANRDVKDAGEKEIREAKNLHSIAQQKAKEARDKVENGDNSASNSGDIQAEIDQLKGRLKETTDVNAMVKIFDRINKLKNQENGASVSQNSEKVEKLRINKSREAAEKAALNARESSEKQLETAKTKAQLQEDRITKASEAAQSKTRELARKQVDKIRSEEAKKTEAAEKETDSLKDTLSKFVKSAHDKLFAGDAGAQLRADQDASKAKADREAANEEFKKAKLAANVANTKEAAAAEHLKGLMKRISESSNDKDELSKLSQEAMTSKSNVMTTRVAAQAAATALAEKQQAMLKFQVKADEAEKTAEKKDAAVAQEAQPSTSYWW
jgi:hypothetical protein